jgi:uncharacterized protein
VREVVGAGLGPQISFVGPFGVGKTTAVLSVCSTQVLMTEVFSSNAQSPIGKHLKPTTTVGLEIGEWVAPDGRVICVIGTPGQERFDMVRRSAMPRSNAVVLWLYGGHAEARVDAELWLDFVTREIPKRKLVVAMTRLGDDPDALAPFRKIVDRFDPNIPLVVADPRESMSVANVLETAFARSMQQGMTG